MRRLTRKMKARQRMKVRSLLPCERRRKLLNTMPTFPFEIEYAQLFVDIATVMLGTPPVSPISQFDPGTPPVSPISQFDPERSDKDNWEQVLDSLSGNDWSMLVRIVTLFNRFVREPLPLKDLVLAARQQAMLDETRWRSPSSLVG